MADENFSPTFLRASTAYGLSPRIRFDLVLNNLTAWAYTTGRVYLKSDGSPWRPIVHVEDIARAYIAVLEADRETVHNEAFNVGLTTENYQVREIAGLVQDDRSRQPRRIRARRGTGPALLQGRLQLHRAPPARVQAAMDGETRDRATL